MDTKVKSSFASGEFWLYIIVTLGCFYLSYRGYTVEDIKQYHDLVVAKIENFRVVWIPVIVSIVFAAKRTALKAYALWVELQKLKILNQK